MTTEKLTPIKVKGHIVKITRYPDKTGKKKYLYRFKFSITKPSGRETISIPRTANNLEEAKKDLGKAIIEILNISNEGITTIIDGKKYRFGTVTDTELEAKFQKSVREDIGRKSIILPDKKRKVWVVWEEK